MKKYLVILIFFFSVPLFAQQLWWVDTTATGTPGKKIFLGEWTGTKFNINYGNLPVNVKGGTIAITLTQAQIDSLQKARQDGTWNINNVSGTISLPTGASTSANQIDGAQRTGVISYNSGGYGTFTAGTAVDTLSGTSTACIEVEIMNNSAGKILYYGFDGSTSTSNGMGALGYLDTARIKISNLNKIYLISDSATTNVRYAYFNF